MNYDIHSKSRNGFVRIATMGIGGFAGLVAGLLATLVVFAFAAMLRAAYPPWNHGIAALAELAALALLPILAASAPTRHPRASDSARAFGVATICAILVLVAGEVAGAIHIDGSQVAFFITPAVPAPPQH